MLTWGRFVFAVAILGLGIISIVYTDFVHQLQPVHLYLPPTTPGYLPTAVLTGVLLTLAGTLIAIGAARFHAAMALAVLVALSIALLQVPSPFLDPAVLRSPWWVRTFELLGIGAAAWILAGLSDRPVREGWIRTGRILFGVSLPVFGVLHWIYAANVASLIPDFYPFPLLLAYLTGTVKILAGLAIALGYAPRLAALGVALLYALYALTLHIPDQFLERASPAGRASLTSMCIAIAFCGAALIVAGSVPRQDHHTPATGP